MKTVTPNLLYKHHTNACTHAHIHTLSHSLTLSLSLWFFSSFLFYFTFIILSKPRHIFPHLWNRAETLYKTKRARSRDITDTAKCICISISAPYNHSYSNIDRYIRENRKKTRIIAATKNIK